MAVPSQQIRRSTGETMQAIVQLKYGSPDALAFTEIDKPAVGDNEVVVRVVAASVNPYDWHLMRGDPYVAHLMGIGLLRPKQQVRGRDFAGVVEAVGKQVRQFRPGDEVFGEADGAFAEFVAVPEDLVVGKPANLTFEQAATVPLAANTALQGLRDVGRIQTGQTVLINGASGGVGTYAVQIAKTFGAEVTGVCSTRNVDLVRSLGADHVVDYTKEDFSRTGRRYDLVFDLVANRSLTALRRALSPKGTLVLSGGGGGRWFGPIGLILRAVALSPFTGQRLTPLTQKQSKDDLNLLTGLIEAGKVTPVIDRTFSLSDAPDAIGYVYTGRARGKVVITV